MKKQLMQYLAALTLGATVTTNIFAQDRVEPGFKSLFNGKDLRNWKGRPNHWSVEDGCITGTTSKENPAKGNNFLILQQDGTNGMQTVDVADEQESKAAKSGVLAFQIHQGEPMKVQFKNVRIKELK